MDSANVALVVLVLAEPGTEPAGDVPQGLDLGLETLILFPQHIDLSFGPEGLAGELLNALGLRVQLAALLEFVVSVFPEAGLLQRELQFF